MKHVIYECIVNASIVYGLDTFDLSPMELELCHGPVSDFSDRKYGIDGLKL